MAVRTKKKKPAKKTTRKKTTRKKTTRKKPSTPPTQLPELPDFEVAFAEWTKAFADRGIDAKRAHDVLMRIRKRDGGITDDAVIEEASNPRSVLHNAFEWDDTVAAHHHRRTQARQIFRSILVSYKSRPAEPVRAFELIHAAPRNSPTRSVWGTREEAMTNPKVREDLLADAIRQLMALRRRFRDINELDRVMTAIEEVAAEFEQDLEED
jgi:hypothetical protein